VAECDRSGRYEQCGKLHLITAHLHDGGLVRVHVGRDDGSFAAESSAGVGKDPQGLAVGDVHGDGKLDVVVANYASNDVSLLRARGNGHFYSERRIELNASAVGPTAISLGDLDGDGVLDIATANFGSNDVTVLNGIGQGRFKPGQAFAVASQPIAVTILEVTGDDKRDLVTENLGSSAVLVLPSRPDGMFAALEPLRSPAPVVIQMPRRADPGPVLTSDPSTPATVQAAEMPSTLLPVVRVPVAGLPAPMDRIGMSFGAGDSDYAFLMGPNGMSYGPLLAMGKVGVKWIRLEGDASYFTNPQAYQSTAKTVDDLIAGGYNIHFGLSHWLAPYPSDFPNKDFVTAFAQFAGTLAAATNRPGHVIYEIWNEPNGIDGAFWPKPRKGVNEAFLYAKILTEATEAIHTKAPGAVVMSGGLFTYSDSYAADMLAEYNRLRVNRPLALVDRFALHPYPQGADGFDPMKRFHNDLVHAGFADVPVHISEMAGWWCARECIGAWNANNLLHAVEEDVPHINFWGVLPSSGFDAPGSFMDLPVSQFDSCVQSSYAPVLNTPGFKCYPSMYMLSMFKRVAQGRTYQGAIFDSRNVASLPGGVPGDPMSGLRALRFESADDVVIAVYTMDRPRATIPNSGKAYSIAFPDKPIYVASFSGQGYDGLRVDGRYTITHDTGPAYFFFSKTGQLPGQTVVANAVCADGSAPRRGRLQLWHTAWPYNGPSSVLNWLTPGPSDASTVVTVSDQLPLFVSNMYVYAEVADGSGRVLEVRSGVLTAGGPGTPKVVIGKFFSPPTSMVELSGPSLANGAFRVEYLALPEWCTP
jgi:hypothetical protein